MNFQISFKMKNINFLILFVFLTTQDKNLAEAQICGMLYKEQNYTGGKFPLIDGSHVTNFEEEYISVETVWNTTGSFYLEPGCVLTAYNETHFQGQVKEWRTSQINPSLDIDTLLSASCECHKNCKCSDIKMRRNSCARLYFNGCNVCNPMYTDMIKASKSFSNEFSGNKKAIKVRSGCSLTIYSEEEEEGDEVVVDSTEDYWNYAGAIGSYKCECNDSQYVPIPKGPLPPTYPPMITIPSTLEEVSRMIQNRSEPHIGLLAAMNSLKAKRSSRNAYILTVGSTGSGKSSAINLLFDNPTLTEVGVGSSVTTDIHEFRIPVPIDEKGIQNSELRVIDTPGLMDTRGLEQDAKFLATLDEYLANHEELHNRIPNVVFVFHKFTDNRFNGSGSNFVKMLRGLDSFKGRITDSSYSNVVFVLSHFCGEFPENTRKPTARLNAFKKVIQDFSLFPKPLVLAIAENKAYEYSRPLVNGYYKLPNGDFYPKNLFDKIQKLTSSAGDEIGDAVIRTAFRGSGEFNISHSTYSLVGQSNKKVAQYYKVMMDVAFPFEDTEISLLLAKSEENMDSELQKSYPDALKYLQGAFNLRNIRTLADIPKTTQDILELITALRQNKAVLYLIESALGISPPTFPTSVIAGYNFHIFKDSPLTRTPFALGQGTTSDIGFLFPSALTCTVERKVVDFIQFHPNLTDYIQQRLSKLGVEGNIAVDRFTGEVRPGYNIHVASSNGSCTLSAVREIRTFQLLLQDKPILSQEFKKVLIELPVYNETNHDNVMVWNNFFDNYGTHVVNSIYGGGAIEISLQTRNKCDLTQMSQALFQVIQFAEDLTSIHGGNGSALASQHGISHQLKFRGGDPKYYTNDLTKMTLDDAASLLNNWKKSLALNPTILTTDIGLTPIGDIAKKVGTKQNITTEIIRATQLYFHSQLKYNPKPLQQLATYEARDDIPTSQNFAGFTTIIQMMMNQTAESNRRFETMMEKFEQTRLANDARLLAERNATRQWEREQEQLRQNWTRQDALNRREDERARQKVVDDFRADQARKDAEWREEHARLESARRTAQDAINKRNHDLMTQIINRPVPSPSCLKKGTQILMGDGGRKAVELLEIGDLVLDHKFQPYPVLGITYEFLQSQSYYGFDNESFFFTDSHIFVGPQRKGRNESETRLRYYVQNLPWFLEQNPLMEFIGAEEMGTQDSFDIFKLHNDSALGVEGVRVYRDSSVHPETDRIYFMQVGSPFGTYFANGFVCRHEIPPLDHWPNTMALLFKVFRTQAMEFVGSQRYTEDFIDKTYRIAHDIRDRVLTTLSNFLRNRKPEVGNQIDIEFDTEEGQNVLDGIFSNPSIAAMATKIYAMNSKIISRYLDDPTSKDYVGHEFARGLQNEVYGNVVRQFVASAKSEFGSCRTVLIKPRNIVNLSTSQKMDSNSA